MEKRKHKFLEFAGHNIYFKKINGAYWVAIKPICEALGVDYNNQFKNIKKDSILKDQYQPLKMPDRRERMQTMGCLSEGFLYGWLFNIRSTNPNFNEYKLECYNVLFNFFTGSITKEKLDDEAITALDQEFEDFNNLEEELLKAREDKSEMQLEKTNLLHSLNKNPSYQKLKFYEAKIRFLNSRVKTLEYYEQVKSNSVISN